MDPNETKQLIPTAPMLPKLAHFEEFPSLRMARSEKDSILIGFDSEWISSETRLATDMLTWQAAVIWNGKLYEFVWLRVGNQSISIDLIVGRIVDYLDFKSIDYAE